MVSYSVRSKIQLDKRTQTTQLPPAYSALSNGKVILKRKNVRKNCSHVSNSDCSEQHEEQSLRGLCFPVSPEIAKDSS